MTTAEIFVLDSQHDVPVFLRKIDYRELLFICSKPQIRLIAERLELDIPVTAKKGEILLQVIQSIQGDVSESKQE